MNDFCKKWCAEILLHPKRTQKCCLLFKSTETPNDTEYGMRCDQEKTLMNGDLTLCTDITLTEV